MSDEKTSPGPWHIHVNAADDLEINSIDGNTVVKWYCSEDCAAPGDPALIASAPTLRDQRDRAVALLRTACSLLRLEGFHHVVREVETFISEVDVS